MINPKIVFSHFAAHGDFVDAAPYGSGHINDTIAVNASLSGTPVRYLLQRLNHHVFKKPIELMENVERVLRHQQAKLKEQDHPEASRNAMTLVYNNDGKSYYQDEETYVWRCYLFVENAQGYDIIETEEQATEAAKAFGNFQKLLADLPGERLHETIPNFHNTPARLARLEEVIALDPQGRAASVKAELDFIFDRKEDTEKLLKLNAEGLIPERITHNDTKLNNVLLDDKTQEGICVIDLDTTMPGLGLYDFGDLIRTSTSPAAEDEKDVSKVKMQMNMFEALVKGYVGATKEVLTPTEVDNLSFGGKIITLETAIRFITDFIEGDVYFKTKYADHNLDRCRTQIALVKSIESQLDAMQAVVQKYL